MLPGIDAKGVAGTTVRCTCSWPAGSPRGPPGGGEVQVQATAEAVRELGIAARMWRPWEDDLDDCDLLHLFGTAPDHLPVIEAAHRRGVPVAPLDDRLYDLPSLWREPRGLARRLAGCGKFLLRGRLHDFPHGGESCTTPSICCCPIHRPKPGSCGHILPCRASGFTWC